MQRSEVQCVYWSHGRYDSDLQDKMFAEVMPSFFTDGDTSNFLGIESAGTFTDQERDEYLRKVERNPIDGLIADQVNGVTDAVRGRVVALSRFLTSMGNGCLLSREVILLGKRNAENPGRVVLPYHESYPTAEIRDEIGRRSDDLLSILSLRKDRRIFWKALVDITRQKNERMMRFVSERNENWLRMLRELTIRAEQRRTRFKILVTLGRWHFQLTEKLRNELSDKLVIHDDVVLPDSNSYGLDGNDYLVDGQLRRNNFSDEDYLRAIFFNVAAEVSLYRADQDRTGFYAIDRAELAKIWEDCRRTSVEEIAFLLGLIVDESQCTEYLPLDDFVRARTLQDEYLRNIGGLEGGVSLLVDRRYHPNNLYIDRLCVLSMLCDVMAVADSDSDVVSLLRQVVYKILPEKLHLSRSAICRFIVDKDGCFPRSIAGTVMLIASKTPRNQELWQDDSEGNRAGYRLIGLARAAVKRWEAEKRAVAMSG